MTKAPALALSLLVAAISGCGGGSSPTAPSPFLQTLNGSVSSFGYVQHPISVPRSGTMTSTLTWSSSSVDLDLYLTSSSCADIYLSFCTRLAVSNRSTGTSEVIARSVASGESFKLWVDSFSSSRQNYTIQIRIE